MNSEDTKRLTYQIMSNARMSLDFFMYLPSGCWTNKDHSTVSINANPVLYIRYRQPKNYASEFDLSHASFKITPRNLYRVVRFFNEILNWLYDKKYEDLFLYNDENQLIFNADYKNLSANVKDFNSNQVMAAVPSIVQLGSKTYEGVRIFINKTIHCISLTYEELSTLHDILSHFSFSETTGMLLLTYDFIQKHEFITPAPDPNKIKTPFD